MVITLYGSLISLSGDWMMIGNHKKKINKAITSKRGVAGRGQSGAELGVGGGGGGKKINLIG